MDNERAKAILEEECDFIRTLEVKGEWVEIVQGLSDECKAKNKTMIAMLGTALLAKATNPQIDAFSLQVGTDTSGRSYSARALCKDVLAAHAYRLGIDLGVSGHEPLNNQPFFGKIRVSTDLKVRTDAKKGLHLLVAALGKLDQIETEPEARNALRAFLQVRRRQRSTVVVETGVGDNWDMDYLIAHVELFVSEDSEGGKRAQAVAAGIFDVLFGEDRVDVKRVNDPSRRMPGDVGIFALGSTTVYERVIEVRDKPIIAGDLTTFITAALQVEISKMAMLAVSASQEPIDEQPAIRWASAQKCRFRVFWGWRELINEALHWSFLPGIAIGPCVRRISRRLEALEISEKGQRRWLAPGDREDGTKSRL